MITFKNFIELPQNPELLQSQTASLAKDECQRRRTKAAWFVAIDHIIIKMLDASISTRRRDGKRALMHASGTIGVTAEAHARFVSAKADAPIMDPRIRLKSRAGAFFADVCQLAVFRRSP
jgi:hypothetical protein